MTRTSWLAVLAGLVAFLTPLGAATIKGLTVADVIACLVAGLTAVAGTMRQEPPEVNAKPYDAKHDG